MAGTSRLDRWAWRLGIMSPESPLRINLPVLAVVVIIHALALLAFVPWLFSWSGVILAVVGVEVFGTFGVNICFHRLLTHRGFACPRWLERGMALLGVCCWEGTPISWVAIHRMHHQHSDEEADPHSPRKSLFWSHMGWFL